jgi:hypothetical protein
MQQRDGDLYQHRFLHPICSDEAEEGFILDDQGNAVDCGVEEEERYIVELHCPFEAWFMNLVLHNANFLHRRMFDFGIFKELLPVAVIALRSAHADGVVEELNDREDEGVQHNVNELHDQKILRDIIVAEVIPQTLLDHGDPGEPEGEDHLHHNMTE